MESLSSVSLELLKLHIMTNGKYLMSLTKPEIVNKLTLVKIKGAGGAVHICGSELVRIVSTQTREASNEPTTHNEDILSFIN